MKIQDNLSSQGASARSRHNCYQAASSGVGADVCPGCGGEGWLGQLQVCDPL